VVSADIGLRQC